MTSDNSTFQTWQLLWTSWPLLYQDILENKGLFHYFIKVLDSVTAKALQMIDRILGKCIFSM